MSKILTVTVPAYNAEAYIRNNLESFCLDDIVDDLDVLVVNDGSTDSTPQIVEEYRKRYPQTFRLISKENGGHGSGINCGIQNARGVYFKVVDADDWVDAVAFRKLIARLKHTQADVVSSGFYWVYEDPAAPKEQWKRKAEIKEPFRGVRYGKTYRFDQIADRLYIKMHNMTIRTEILQKNGIHIDEHCWYVDNEYITYPVPWVQTIYFVDAVVYQYRIGRQGQSVGLDKMRRNEDNYDRMLRSLFRFYGRLTPAFAAGETSGQHASACITQACADGSRADVSSIPCSPQKRAYIAGIIARMVAGKIKIMLSFPARHSKQRALRSFDDSLRRRFPEIYAANCNKAVSILRRTHYAAYLPASVLVRRLCR